MSAVPDAWRSVLDELFDGMARAVADLEAAALDWTPTAPDTNSIAAMVTHTCGSIDSWLARAIPEPLERDRDAEFRASATSAELGARVERCRADTHRRLALLATVDPSTIRAVRRLSRNEDMEVTVAWCVEHAIAHAGEHWGQIQLTRQLLPAR